MSLFEICRQRYRAGTRHPRVHVCLHEVHVHLRGARPRPRTPVPSWGATETTRERRMPIHGLDRSGAPFCPHFENFGQVRDGGAKVNSAHARLG